MTLTLYTQNNCNWCDRLKEKLKEWGHEYHEVNIAQDQVAKNFLKQNNHATVPQLYLGEIDVMKGHSTGLTKSLLESRIVVDYPEIPEASF